MQSKENRFISEGNTFEFLPKKIEGNITEKEKVLIELVNGRTPINEFERELLEDIERIKNEKQIVDIPHDFV